MRTHILGFALLLVTGCIVGGEDAEYDDLADGQDPGDDGFDTETIESGTPDATKLNIGFNDGYAEQFAYYPTFFATGVKPAARLCHAYVSWRVAYQAPRQGAISDHASRAFIDDWFQKAQGQCDEALISFKSMTHGSVPSTSAFSDAFEKFAAINWAAETGFTGKIAFTPFNEPNNGADSGNGLGTDIPPRVAARYYLAAERSCRKHGCKVAAGDFASNGNMWDDFRWNCANDNVAQKNLCSTKSSMNPDNRGASYLDIYKNEIVNRATDFGLPAGFRPDYFAYHGWHDTNRYLDAGDHCSSYETCTLRRLLRSLRGSWGNAVIWNTEDGIGQTSSPNDNAQACGAAFLVRLSAMNARLHRVYVTRLKGGAGTLYTGPNAPRPAANILQNRRLQSPAGGCR